MRIKEKVIKEITAQIEGLIRAWLLQINEAFIKFSGEKFPINFKTTLDINKRGGIKIDTEIKFRPEPDISDKASGNVDENQVTIFEFSTYQRPVDRRGPVGRPPRFRALGG